MNRSRYNTDVYLQNNPDWHVKDSAWKAEQVYSMLRRNNVAVNEACEVGCGAGEVLRCLAHKMDGARFTGYEISEIAYKMSLTRESERVKFQLADLMATDKSVYYDVLLMLDVVEHVEDCFSFLRSAKSKAIVKVLHFPLDLSVQALIRVAPILRSRRKDGHVHHFTKETAIEMLKECGYEILDWSYTEKAFELPKTLRRRLMNIPRRTVMAVDADLAVRLLGGCSLLVLAK